MTWAASVPGTNTFIPGGMGYPGGGPSTTAEAPRYYPAGKISVMPILSGMGIIGSVGPGGVKALIKPALKLAATMLAAEALTPNIDIFAPMLGGLPNYGAPAGSAGGASAGGQAMTMTPGFGYGIAGPGVPEPADGTWSRKWNIVTNSRERGTYRIYFWQMMDGYTLMYNPATKGWKRWKQRKSIVLSADPRMSTIGRAVRATEGKLKRLAKKTRHLTFKG